MDRAMLIELVLINSFVSAFVLLLLYKIGFINYCQLYSDTLIDKMNILSENKNKWLKNVLFELLRCEFCLSFWINAIVGIINISIMCNFGLNMVFIYLLVLIISTPITRKMI